MKKEKYVLNNKGRIVLSKKDKTTDKVILKNGNGIEYVEVGDFVMEKGILYGINRNVGRDIPWIYDGLVSVERRILYTLYHEGLFPSKSYEKVASIIGSLMKNYYPHSDQSPAKTLSRLTRSTAIMIPYLDGKGNFGNPYTKQAAAARYIEARMSKYTQDCFFSENDVDSEIYDMKDNYKYDGREPIYLASKYPNVLMQWNSGIGNGISSILCAFNSIDIFNTAIRMIDDPECSVDIYPDTPIPVNIVNKKELKGCFDKHKFAIRMEGMYHTEVLQDKINGKIIDKNYLVFTSYPINSSPLKIEENLVNFDPKDPNSRMFKEIKDVNVKTTESELQFYIEYEKGCDPEILAEKILKRTKFGDTIGAQFVLIKDNQPKRYTPRTVLLEWLSIRIDQKRRYIHQKIVKILKEKVITEAILIIIKQDALEELATMIKKSADDDTLIANIQKRFGLTSLQAKYISDLQIKRFNKANVNRYKERLAELDKLYGYYKSVADEHSIKELIKSELKEGLEKYGKKRKAKLVNKVAKNLENASKVLIYNNSRYFCIEDYSKLELISDKIDKSYDIVNFENIDKIMIFDNMGNIKIVEGYSFTFTADGIDISSLLGKTAVLDKCVKILPLTKDTDQITLLTKFGYAKTLLIKDVMKSLSGRIINLNKDDELCSVVKTSKAGGTFGILSADQMYYVDISTIPVLKRGSAGNKILKADIAIDKGVFIDNSSDYIIIYGESGYLKVVAAKYLNFSKRKDNYIDMAGKNIFGIYCISNNNNFRVYHSGYHMDYNFAISDTAILITAEDGETSKLRLSTSLGAPIKFLKFNKNDFYGITETL